MVIAAHTIGKVEATTSEVSARDESSGGGHRSPLNQLQIAESERLRLDQFSLTARWRG